MLKVDIQSFSYETEEILNDVSFDLTKGEQLVILGESGCGKSTLLHLVYGLLDLDQGDMSWGGTPILGPRYNLVPGMPFIKLVAQEYNVMPFISVADNVSEHLSRRDLDADRSRVMELLEVVDLLPYSDVMVKQLSGGQKQRVALAKALAKQPELLLLDEPFSHIDTFRKNALRRKLYTFLRDKGISCITATHDPSEALSFADKILMLNEKGHVQAYGSPVDLFKAKPGRYQAGFFDDVSEIHGKFYYPHELKLSASSTPIEVTIEATYFRGSHFLIQAKWSDSTIFFNHFESLDKGMTLFIQPISDD